MANQTSTNPLVYDAASGSGWSGDRKVVLAQWIDDAADIADDDDLAIVVGGATIACKIQLTNNTANNVVMWEMAFPNGMTWSNFSITTIDHGIFVVWVR
jgi:hypothetical protein